MNEWMNEWLTDWLTDWLNEWMKNFIHLSMYLADANWGHNSWYGQAEQAADCKQY